MSSQPPWLHSALQQSHLSLSWRILESREHRRESARTVPREHGLHPSQPHFPGDSYNVHPYYSCSVGQQAPHRHKNRYLALEPYDRTRVLVPAPEVEGNIAGDTPTSSASGSRYLNANWVREFAGGKWWIAGQAPLPRTAHAFLTLGMCPVSPRSTAYSTCSSRLPPMQKIHTIVQLTLMFEGGRRRAHPYFPGTLRQNMIINPEHGCDALPIHVRVDNEEIINDAKCVKTDLRLRWGGAHESNVSSGRDQREWNVTHLLYTDWPDFGVPKDNHSILHFARLVERVNNRHLSHPTNDPNASPPIIVHCSAGVGRTGSFIALSSLLRAYGLLSPTRPPSTNLVLAPPLLVSPLGPLPRNLDDDHVAKEIDALREQRQSMVQRQEQAIWVYKALSDAFEGV